MHTPTTPHLSRRERSLLFITQPRLWTLWPFLPLVKRPPGQHEVCGVLFDAMAECGLPGYSATVILTNVFLMPEDRTALLALPKEVFDRPEEIVDAGWYVD
jgi:hypothetical protein